MLPPVDLSGIGTPTMSFDQAYVLKTASSNDKLEVMASKDCGATWTTVWNAAGSNLATNQNPLATEYLTPAAEDWSNVMLNLPGFNQANVLVKFVATNNNGNNLFLDNINLSSTSTPDGISKNSAIGMSLSVNPNPSNGLAGVEISVTKAQGANLLLINAVGQVVFEKHVSLKNGNNHYMVDLSDFSNGIYTLSVESEQMQRVQKIVVSK
jgi:hypothetical protein